MGAFGDKFRKTREKKNLSLDDVSNVTKISSRMLQAIEEERFDQLPGGVFNKGFIRAYAKHLGLNDEEAVTDYLACLRQAQIDAHEVWETPATVGARNAAPVGRSAGAYEKPSLKAHPPVQVEDELPDLHLPRAEDVRPPRRDYIPSGERTTPWTLIAGVAVVVLLVALLWMRHSRGSRAAGATAGATAGAHPATIEPAATRPGPVTTTATAGSQNSAPTPPRAAATSRTSVPNSTSRTATLAPANQAGNALVKPAAAAPIGAAASTVSAPNSGANSDNDGPEVIVRKVAPAAEIAKPAVTMTLLIRAEETSWISVTADGQPVTHETLIAPAETSVRAAREIVARIGNAGGVSFLFNGKEIPAQGAESEVKTFVFDASGMREVPNQPPVQSQPAAQSH